ncbi:uncharacterized protein BcabD6B2_40350 [Babesia caballi]|uniref:Uncharacterized protein n=1 Tax=Babesia caballi TaxID=5871 RepID=A0AAV4LXJ2_BABCB|nr:hypothetical protein BcabD6B2_40350 [Babesia caballi]
MIGVSLGGVSLHRLQLDHFVPILAAVDQAAQQAGGGTVPKHQTGRVHVVGGDVVASGAEGERGHGLDVAAEDAALGGGAQVVDEHVAAAGTHREALGVLAANDDHDHVGQVRDGAVPELSHEVQNQLDGSLNVPLVHATLTHNPAHDANHERRVLREAAAQNREPVSTLGRAVERERTQDELGGGRAVALGGLVKGTRQRVDAVLAQGGGRYAVVVQVLESPRRGEAAGKHLETVGPGVEGATPGRGVVPVGGLVLVGGEHVREHELGHVGGEGVLLVADADEVAHGGQGLLGDDRHEQQQRGVLLPGEGHLEPGELAVPQVVGGLEAKATVLAEAEGGGVAVADADARKGDAGAPTRGGAAEDGQGAADVEVELVAREAAKRVDQRLGDGREAVPAGADHHQVRQQPDVGGTRPVRTRAGPGVEGHDGVPKQHAGREVAVGVHVLRRVELVHDLALVKHAGEGEAAADAGPLLLLANVVVEKVGGDHGVVARQAVQPLQRRDAVPQGDGEGAGGDAEVAHGAAADDLGQERPAVALQVGQYLLQGEDEHGYCVRYGGWSRQQSLVQGEVAAKVAAD